MAISTLRLALALICSLVLFACSQGQGEPCQKTADCSDGLECRISRGSARGTCEPPRDEEPEPDAGRVDSGGPGIPNEDAAALESDAGAEADAATTKADAATTEGDAAAQTVDAGSDDDAG